MKYRLTLAVQCLMLPVILTYAAVQAHASGSQSLVDGNTAFACELYKNLSVSEGNLFFSPYSISTALAMTYAGARGDTESQMASTMRFSMKQDVHPEFAQLASRLTELQNTGNIKLGIANSLWPQKGYPFLDGYLSLIKKNYGVSITPVDYKHNTEVARTTINGWAEKETKGKIANLIPPGVLDSLPRLVLVNAIYFKGNWENQFKTIGTKEAPFHIAPDKTVQVPMMTQEQSFRYADLGTLEILELPYVGNEMSMIILLPKKTDGIKQLEADFSMENLRQWESQMNKQKICVFLPKFKLTSTFQLDKTLSGMGMADAFSETKANFAGMDGRTDWLYIGAVLHKAFVEVNEEGTEAAAATAVVMVETRCMPLPPPTFRADHPFVFLIRERKTGSILFAGRMTDPTKTGQ